MKASSERKNESSWKGVCAKSTKKRLIYVSEATGF